MKIHIPTTLADLHRRTTVCQRPGATVGDALQQLTGAYPELRQQLYTGEGKLRSFVNIYLNDDDIRYCRRKKQPRPVRATN